jgi:hypothetical protein
MKEVVGKEESCVREVCCEEKVVGVEGIGREESGSVRENGM